MFGYCRSPVLPRMLALSLSIAVAATSCVNPACARGGVALEVVVSNVRTAAGHIRVAVCTKGSFLKQDCPFHASAPAHVGSVVVAVRDLPEGVYAIQAYHDEDDTGRFKRSLFGVPEEGFGFSRDAPIGLAPPRFDDAAFDLLSPGRHVVLQLRYFD